MKKILTMAMIAFTVNAMAQQTKTQQQVDNANREVYKVNNTVNSINNTARNTQNTIDGTKKLFEGVAGVFNLNKSKKHEEAKSDNVKTTTSNTPEVSKPAVNNTPATVSSAPNQTTITISNIDYMQMKNINSQLKENTNVSEINPSLAGNVATLIVKHTGSTDGLVDFLMSRPNNKLDVKGFQNGNIQFSLK